MKLINKFSINSQLSPNRPLAKVAKGIKIGRHS